MVDFLGTAASVVALGYQGGQKVSGGFYVTACWRCASYVCRCTCPPILGSVLPTWAFAQHKKGVR